MSAQAFSLWLAPHAMPGFMKQNTGLFGAGSAGGVGKWDFPLPTFVCPGDQPEVLCFLLEFLFADLLGLYQMKYPCREKQRASDSAMLNLRLRWICTHTSLSLPEMQKGRRLHRTPRGPGGSLGANPGLAKDQEKSHLKPATAH